MPTCVRCTDQIYFEDGDWYHEVVPPGTHDARFCGGDDTRDDQIAEPFTKETK